MAYSGKGDYEVALKQLDEIRAIVRKKITKTNRYCKNVTEETTNQGEHDLLAQMNQEITDAVNELHQRLTGE